MFVTLFFRREIGGGLLFFVFILCAVSLPAQTNRALLVAISDYPIENGWDETHASNDCELIIPMLKRNGYNSNHIRTLLDEKATKANIVKELANLARKAKAGDYIYLHFSGHGQQMADDNGDEPDGLDEAFIPYDAHYRYVAGKYEGENHLRDDELEYWTDRIRSEVGKEGNVIVVLDACHSGTGTRIVEEDDYIRGTSYIFASDNFEQEESVTEAFRLNLRSESRLADVTVFSACQPDELNFEYKTGSPATYYGSLTFFFCETMNERRLSGSNRAFYLRLKNKMTAYFSKRPKTQTPYFESTAENSFFRVGK